MRFPLALTLSLLLHLGVLAALVAGWFGQPETRLDPIRVHLTGSPGKAESLHESFVQPSSAQQGQSGGAAPDIPRLSLMPVGSRSTTPVPVLNRLDIAPILTQTPDASGTSQGAPGHSADRFGPSGAPAGPVLAQGEGDKAFGSVNGPRFARKVEPVYPPRARRLGLTGSVELMLSIDEKGRLTGVQVLAPAGHGFDEEAVRAVRRSSFHPALKEGDAVSSTALLTVRFEMDR
jgi:TonB family protein